MRAESSKLELLADKCCVDGQVVAADRRLAVAAGVDVVREAAGEDRAPCRATVLVCAREGVVSQ